MYPAGHLKNLKTGRFHPIFFRCAPRPSDRDDAEMVRYKSAGHHTLGVDTLDESKTFVTSQSNLIETGLVWEWDGEEMPAFSCDFPPPDKLVPASIQPTAS